MNPLASSGVHSLVVGCYTHPEYSISMEHTHAEAQTHALLLRGMEGEPVADPRRQPAMRGIVQGRKVLCACCPGVACRPGHCSHRSLYP